MSSFKPYNYNEHPVNIEKYIILGFQPCGAEEYDVFDSMLNDYAKHKVDIINRQGYDLFDVYDKTKKDCADPFVDGKGKKVYLYTEIVSTRETPIILCTQSFSNSKIWFNGVCISINQTKKYSYIALSLTEGKNSIIIEKLNPTKLTISTILIDNYFDPFNYSIQSVRNLNSYIDINPLTVISDTKYCPNAHSYKFMLFQNRESRKKYKIEIIDSETNIIKRLTSYTNEVVEIDIKELRTLTDTKLKAHRIVCYFNEDTNPQSVEWCIYVNDFIDEARQLNIDLLNRIKTAPSSYAESDIIKLEKIINNPSLNEYYNFFWTAYNYKKFLLINNNSANMYLGYERPKLREIYIRSKLDDTYIRIGQRLPEHYDVGKKYPVFIALATSNEGWFCWLMRNSKLNEECLIFDVTGRGVTGGSYIGEASFFEIFDWIKSNYNIDENRVYLLGYSNGGYATWAISQNHPHIAAAIYPLCATPQFENIENVSNTPVYQLISPKDAVYEGKDELLKQSLEKHGNYYETRFEEYSHIDFQYHIINRSILNKMLTFTRNPYPDEIIFSTCRNRHLRSFWIELHGISKKYKYAKIKAKVEGSHTLSISISGARGFTLYIPPQIDRKSFDVIINGRCISCKNVVKEKIHFQRKKVWEETETVLSSNLRKGTGLLDVYLNKVNIVLPSQSSRELSNTAKVFSTPCTYGYDPQIYASYKIFTTDSCPKHIFDDNLIILESTKCPNSYSKMLQSTFYVKYDESGYTYRNERVNGDYLIIQVLENPFRSEKSILLVSTNNETLFNKCIFTRKIKVPYYMNGIHPYLNNLVLIYNGKDFFGIYEDGEKIERIV